MPPNTHCSGDIRPWWFFLRENWDSSTSTTLLGPPSTTGLASSFAAQTSRKSYSSLRPSCYSVQFRFTELNTRHFLWPAIDKEHDFPVWHMRTVRPCMLTKTKLVFSSWASTDETPPPITFITKFHRHCSSTNSTHSRIVQDPSSLQKKDSRSFVMNGIWKL